MRAADALALKRILIQDVSRWDDDFQDSQGEFDRCTGMSAWLPDSPTYFVTAEMAAIAKRAGETFPVNLLTLENLPSPTGFIFFDAPIGHVTADERRRVHAVAWERGWLPDLDRPTTPPDEHGVAEHEFTEVINIWPLMSADKSPRLIPVNCWEWFFPEPSIQRDAWVNGGSHQMLDAEFDGAHALAAAWVLMQQSISQSVRSDPPSRIRRGMTKLAASSELVIVRLRRLKAEGSEEVAERDDAATEWSHRWLVSGHWRQQYYPSNRENRAVWISPYVKGPAAKPLILKDRITAWVR